MSGARRGRIGACLLAALACAGTAGAQSSPGYRLTEHTLNAGGHPAGGQVPRSAGYRITLDAIGEIAVRARLSGPSFRLEGGFASAYRPPGEVRRLLFRADRESLSWDPEPSVGNYALYRDMVDVPGRGAFAGACLRSGVVETTAPDAAIPPAGALFRYLVTARNRLGEEGSAGRASGGTERPLTESCP